MIRESRANRRRLSFGADGGPVEGMPAPSAGAKRFGFARREETTAWSILRLEGRHQIDNAVVAVRVLEMSDATGVDVPGAAPSPKDWLP